MKVVTIYTKCGWLAAGWSVTGLSGLVLPHKSCEEVLERLVSGLQADSITMLRPEQLRNEQRKLIQDIERFFKGEAVNFNPKIDWAGYTPFQRRVLSVVQQIQYGKVSSYKEVAIKAGFPKAARAVGGVMRSNRTPLVIPCHRVIASDGSLGGFSSGLQLKKILLKLENIPVV